MVPSSGNQLLMLVVVSPQLFTCRYQREVPPLPALGGGAASVFSAQPMMAPQYAGASAYGAGGYGGMQTPPYVGQVMLCQPPACAVVCELSRLLDDWQPAPARVSWMGQESEMM